MDEERGGSATPTSNPHTTAFPDHFQQLPELIHPQSVNLSARAHSALNNLAMHGRCRVYGLLRHPFRWQGGARLPGVQP